MRANIIKGHKLDGFRSGGAEERSSSEVVNANESSWNDDFQTAETESFSAVSDGINSPVAEKPSNQAGRVSQEFKKQKQAFSGPLLPSEVCLVAALIVNLFKICKNMLVCMHIILMHHLHYFGGPS